MSDGKPLRSWGAVWTNGIRHSIDHDCESCKKWSFYPGNKEGLGQVVGFDYSPDPGFQEPKIGKLIVECAVCGEKLWWHVREDLVRFMLRSRDLGLLPQWPKD